jgi:hypothetical protein
VASLTAQNGIANPNHERRAQDAENLPLGRAVARGGDQRHIASMGAAPKSRAYVTAFDSEVNRLRRALGTTTGCCGKPFVQGGERR